MNTEEIRRAKQDAEAQIRTVLETLQENTGMFLRSVEISVIEGWCSGTGMETKLGRVAIDLQL